MSFEQLLENLNPQVVASLKRAVELGKWPNGGMLTPEQRRLCGEAVLRWEQRNLPAEARAGYVPPKPPKAEPCDESGKEQKLNWV